MSRVTPGEGNSPKDPATRWPVLREEIDSLTSRIVNLEETRAQLLELTTSTASALAAVEHSLTELTAYRDRLRDAERHDAEMSEGRPPLRPS